MTKLRAQLIEDLQAIKSLNPALYESLKGTITEKTLSRVSEIFFHKRFHELESVRGKIQIFARLTSLLASVYHSTREIGFLLTQLELFNGTDLQPLLGDVIGDVEADDIKRFMAFFKFSTPYPQSLGEMWGNIKKYLWDKEKY